MDYFLRKQTKSESPTPIMAIRRMLTGRGTGSRVKNMPICARSMCRTMRGVMCKPEIREQTIAACVNLFVADGRQLSVGIDSVRSGERKRGVSWNSFFCIVVFV